MKASLGASISGFYDWLAKTIPSDQLSDMYMAYQALAELLSKQTAFYRLGKNLDEVQDADAIDQLIQDLGNDKLFMRSYKPRLKLLVLHHYANYIREMNGSNPANRESRTDESCISDDVATSSEAGLIQWLKDHFNYVDAGYVVDVLHKAEQFAFRNHLSGIRLFGVRSLPGRGAIGRLRANNAFIKSDSSFYQEFRHCAKYYLMYLSSLERRNMSSEEAQTASVTVSVSNESISDISSTPAPERASVCEPSALDCEETKLDISSEFQSEIENAILQADLDGMTMSQLAISFPSATMVSLKQIRDHSHAIIDLYDRLVHVDAFVDLDIAADSMLTILDKLMGKNNGYVSSVQLFDYVRAEMQMFLNDNALCDERSVYYLAKHFFTKLDWKGQHYVFTSGTHISKAGKEVLQTNMDVITKYAKDSGGFFAYDDLVQYLERVGIKTGNLRGQMQIGVKPLFFYYSSVDLVLVESMHIDQAWLEQAARALKRLFADVGDHIVIRSILPIWYEQLPTLPSYRQWTPLLFQYVLKFYGKQLGARTIGSQLNQRYDILHSMIVCDDSEIQTFGDAVIAYIVDSNIEQRHFEAEELRHTLVNGGFIAGNELIWHMQKAIGKDPRFSWDVTGDNVSIKV